MRKLCKNDKSFFISGNQKRELHRQNDKHRGSNFIGVSKNGHAWQVTKILGDRKHYICSVFNIQVAAIINDMIDIQFKGKEAMPNFNYNWYHLAALMEMRSLLTIFDKKEKSTKSDAMTNIPS